MAAPAVSAPVRLVRGLNCPSCGAGIELHAGGHARNVVCGHCHSVLDAGDPNLAVLQKFEAAAHIEPAIPLGTRGTLHGAAWEVVGFQVRAIHADGEEYAWREYLLFNPYRGFRYLTEYDGHWNDVVAIHTLPSVQEGARPVARLRVGEPGRSEEFRHFQTAEARTTYVLGEFPWQVRVGDVVRARDFVAPPRMLSDESTAEETTWSLGSYVPGSVIWKAFGLDGRPPYTVGVFANQPNPLFARARGVWRLARIFVVVLAALGIARCATARNEEVFARQYTFDPVRGDSGAFVTAPFALAGRTSNVALELESDVDNRAIFLDLGLVNDETGEVRDVGRELAYFHGVEDGESWREGSENARVVLPRVPAGRYYLRVRPEVDASQVSAFGTPSPIRYTVRVRRDVPRPGYWLFALGALLLPTLVPVMRSWSFEQQRWQQSDHASSSGTSGDDDDDSGGDDE